MRHLRVSQWVWTCLGASLIACLSFPALAQGNPVDCNEYVGLTHRMAGCLRATIESGMEKFLTDFYPMISTIINAFLILAVSIYGVMLAQGMVEKVGRDTIIFLLKLAFVVGLVNNAGMIYDRVTTLMDSVAVAVVTFTPPSDAVTDNTGEENQLTCLASLSSGGDNQWALSPWLGIDCLLDTVIGIKIPRSPTDPLPTLDGVWYNPKLDNPDASKTNRGPARGMVHFFTSSAQSSIVGIALAAIGFTFIFGTIMLIIRAFFSYIMGYLGVAFLVIISPLIIPLVLMKHTKQYFDKWVKLLISMAVQPVIMLIFLIFSITAMDLALFSGKYSLAYTIAGDASREANFDLNRYLGAYRNEAGVLVGDYDAVPPIGDVRPIIGPAFRTIVQIKTSQPREAGTGNPITLVRVNNDPDAPVGQNSAITGVKEGLCTKEKMEADQNLAKACGFKRDVKRQVEAVDWILMAQARQPPVEVTADVLNSQITPELMGAQIMKEVLASGLFCVLVVFVMNGLLQVIPMVASDIVGDAGQTPSLLQSLQGGGGSLSKSMNGIAGNFHKSISDSLKRS